MQMQQAAKSNVMVSSWHGLHSLHGGILTSSMRELMRSRLFFSTVLWLVCCFEPARVQDTPQKLTAPMSLQTFNAAL